MFQEISLKAPDEKKLCSHLLQSNYYEIVGLIDWTIKVPHRLSIFYLTEAVADSCKKGISEACNFIKNETLAQVFSREFCKMSKNTFSYRTLLVAASDLTETICEKIVYTIFLP